MQAVILCGGLGTRMREETEFRPKPMVSIGEHPVLWHIMKHYSVHGIKDFILVLGYKGDVIKHYFLDYELQNCDVTLELGKGGIITKHDQHDESDWLITLANTGATTLKGGRIKRIEKYIEGDCFVATYGDGLSNVDVTKLIAFHKAHGKIATVTGVNPAARFGELKIDGDRVLRFAEKPDKPRDYINGGFFVFDRRIFDYLTADEDCDLEMGAFEELARIGEMMIYRHDDFWGCMDTQRDVDWLRSLWASDNVPWKTW
ncbi:glucose-1-phosphate cytidylyltransferase [Nisaea sediminum]|uniref:glucose-1-phosphate cytidylyltransferase n=1 Tax=Nisaea sediminum TaxID=2775867 RepID=UPI00186686EF|nr:glucose-1-phosphate cytidylyltransferase [Nisaea sediminum]